MVVVDCRFHRRKAMAYRTGLKPSLTCWITGNFVPSGGLSVRTTTPRMSLSFNMGRPGALFFARMLYRFHIICPLPPVVVAGMISTTRKHQTTIQQKNNLEPKNFASHTSMACAFSQAPDASHLSAEERKRLSIHPIDTVSIHQS